ncbi:hypothetical protein LOK49_LG10G01139 [Camellia lanceoleosa]|uniref:Uncharacterized protein n=1 Tax=Camellia lanceoleosa TaxID=1840588 RepID=A0ACC0G8J0_9ERIC|nr:hypothetical protein LOK49_LG10G01139 [Camellia lanceoleosa]
MTMRKRSWKEKGKGVGKKEAESQETHTSFPSIEWVGSSSDCTNHRSTHECEDEFRAVLKEKHDDIAFFGKRCGFRRKSRIYWWNR